MINSNNYPIVTRSSPAIKKNYIDYRDILRFDFWYSCAYCSISEEEANAIGFEIDHYLPKKHFPDRISDYSNLLWSCKPCNGYKLDFYPDKIFLNEGFYIIRIDEDNPENHFELQNVLISAKTKTGEFNIEILNLNRQTLRRIREIRKRFFKASEYIIRGVNYLSNIKLDLIHTMKHRLLFQHIRNRVNEKYNEMQENIIELLKDYARSPLIDNDPDKKHQTKKRREYLKKIKAINSESAAVKNIIK